MTASERSGEPRGICRVLGIKEVCERVAIGCGRQRGPLRARELHDAWPQFGLSHDAADGRPTFRVEECRDHRIRRNHEVFDEITRRAGLDRAQGNDVAIVHDRTGLDGLELQCAALNAALTQGLGCGILQAELGGERVVARHARWRWSRSG